MRRFTITTSNGEQILLENNIDGTLMADSLGFDTEAALSAATSLTVPTGANVALVQVEGQNVRWRDDGTSPTASVGQRLLVGESRTFGGDLSALEFIQEAASASLNVSYY